MPKKTEHKKPGKPRGGRRRHKAGNTTPDPAASETPISDALDREEERAVLRQIELQGIGSLSGRQKTVFRRYERRQSETRRWQVYETIPRAHWRRMSNGRWNTQLQKQAASYGLPIGGEFISLPDFVAAFHDFLGANARRLARAEDDTEGLLAGPETASLERLRRAQAVLKEMEIDERRKELLPRELVAQHMDRLGTILRRRLEIVERGYGPEPCEVFEEGLSEFEAYLAKVMKNGNLGSEEQSNGENTFSH